MVIIIIIIIIMDTYNKTQYMIMDNKREDHIFFLISAKGRIIL
jgi:hypothetical protein